MDDFQKGDHYVDGKLTSISDIILGTKNLLGDILSIIVSECMDP